MSPHPGFNALACVLVAACQAHDASGLPRGPDASPHGGAAAVVILNDNGAWSWFEDERAVIDPDAGILLVSSVAHANGSGGEARDGNVEVVAVDLVTGATQRSVLHRNLQADDHDSAALFVRPDGRYVAMYSRHGSDPLSRWRVSDRAGDASAWADEATIDHGAPATYSNLYQVTDGSGTVLYSFVRSVGRDPNLLVSTDDGATWSLDGRLLDGPGRPYVRYAVDHQGRIHLITTEQHPRDFTNGIYYGVIEDGRLRRADGTVVDANVLDDAAVPPERLTPVFADRGTGPAWTIDLHVDRDGFPYAVFSVHRVGPMPAAAQRTTPLHRYYYARFDGVAWHVHPLADAGSALARNERFYTGLVALHPHDPGRVFISTDVHPATGDPLISARDGLVHHELFEGVTADAGNTWTWTPVTADSTVDNIRPIVPHWDGMHTALLWLRGSYQTYDDYDLDVVARISDGMTIAGSSAACRSDQVLRT